VAACAYQLAHPGKAAPPRYLSQIGPWAPIDAETMANGATRASNYNHLCTGMTTSAIIEDQAA
jgi:hypothetical protein